MWQADDALGYVLHTMPYRGSSLICDVFSEEYGRVRLLALSARGPTSRFRGIFQTFSLLKFSARGRNELRTVSQATCIKSLVGLQSIPLFCAYYMHELLRLLLPLEEPSPQLFAVYAQTLDTLTTCDTQNVAPCLRQFEKTLLEVCGYGLNFTMEARTSKRIEADHYYQFYVSEGFVSCAKSPSSFLGEHVMAIAAEQWYTDPVAHAAKIIFRRAICDCLQGRTLASRALLKSFL